MSRGATHGSPRKENDELGKSASASLSAKGASSSKRRLADRFRSYISHHRTSAIASYVRLFSNAGQTLMTSLVVGITLALPALLIIALQNIQLLGENWDAQPKLTLYLHERAQDAAIKDLEKRLRSDIRIQQVSFISAEEALRQFESFSGFGEVLNGLESNPLPAAFEVEPTAQFGTPDQQQRLAAELQQEAIVQEASVDLAWVQRFLAIAALARNIVIFLASLLACGALIAIGNTVRLIIENRKEEIIVIKLVGGTDGFVRRPLLYSGGLYGIFGGLLACAIVSLGLNMIDGAAGTIIASYGSNFELKMLQLSHVAALLACGFVIGWLGALIAVGRHISAIEPN